MGGDLHIESPSLPSTPKKVLSGHGTKSSILYLHSPGVRPRVIVRPSIHPLIQDSLNDPMRHSSDDLPEDVVEAMTQSLLKEGMVINNAFGLLPFCQKNLAPAVSHHFLMNFLYYTLLLLITSYHFSQADDRFWKAKYNHEAAKQARAAKRAERKAATAGTSRKKKPSASDLFKLDDTSDEEEVIL